MTLAPSLPALTHEAVDDEQMFSLSGSGGCGDLRPSTPTLWEQCAKQRKGWVGVGGGGGGGARGSDPPPPSKYFKGVSYVFKKLKKTVYVTRCVSIDVYGKSIAPWLALPASCSVYTTIFLRKPGGDDPARLRARLVFRVKNKPTKKKVYEVHRSAGHSSSQPSSGGRRRGKEAAVFNVTTRSAERSLHVLLAPAWVLRHPSHEMNWKRSIAVGANGCFVCVRPSPCDCELRRKRLLKVDGR